MKMKNKKVFSSLHRKRQMQRQQIKMVNRRQEFFIQNLLEEKYISA